MTNVVRLSGSQPIQVPIESIDPPHSPLRVSYEGEEGELEELGRSMLETGQMSPIQVFEESGRYRCVTGDRRFRAAKAVEATHVWITVIDPRDEIGTIALQIEENIHRKSLDPYEEAAAYQRMLELGLTIAQIAPRVRKNELYVRERLQFASAASGVHEYVVTGELTPKKAALIARIPDGEEQVSMARSAVASGFTTAQVRDAVEHVQFSPRRGKPRRYLSPDKTLMEAARVTKWLHKVGKSTNFKALTGDDIRALRQAFGHELTSGLRMVYDLIDAAAKKVPATAKPVPSTSGGNVSWARNHRDEWPSGDIKMLEDWIKGRLVCPIDDLALKLGREVSAVQEMVRVVKRRTRRVSR